MADAERAPHLLVHFVGSIPLPDAEIVYRTLAEATGPYLVRLPDGETDDCASILTRNSIWDSSITTMQKATRIGWRRLGAICVSTVSRPNLEWRAAIRHG